MATSNPGTTWRSHPLDGAMLWFDPNTGMHVRWDGPATRPFRRAAPRVVMFGITNRCNLSCGFCSRDLEAPSEWTADSAFEVLAGLAREGVLEAAFGGGEPLVFRGFDQLVTRLAAETSLAVHFTTNGTLLTPERLAGLQGKVGEIRLSVYEGNPWEDRVAMLATAGMQFGVNILITPARLPSLPALLDRLAVLGCRDVALLSYVGYDRSLHLSGADEALLRTIIASSPVRVRLSVCFGDRLDPTPRLFEGVEGDCGAGVDFLSLTPDRKVKACSFQDEGIPVSTAADVMRVWRQRRPQLLGATQRAGCARTRLQTSRSALPDGIRIWRGFSGNNSGECVLVGRFDRAEDAEKYLAELLPGFRPGLEFSDEWQALLAREGIRVAEESRSPEAMVAVGSNVMLATNEALSDDFPSLRTLLWKRGGRAVYTGIHEHDAVMIAAGLRFPNVAALDAAEARLAIDEVGDFQRKGLSLFGLVWQNPAAPLEGRMAALREVATQGGGTLAAELVPVRGEPNLAQTLARPAPEDTPEWLFCWFDSAEAARAAGRGMDGLVTLADRYLLVGAPRIAKRPAAFLQSRAAVMQLVIGPRVNLTGHFSRPGKAEGPSQDELAAALRARLPDEPIVTCGHWRGSGASIETTRPDLVLSALVAAATAEGWDHWISAEPVPDQLTHAFARIAEDLNSSAYGMKAGGAGGWRAR